MAGDRVSGLLFYEGIRRKPLKLLQALQSDLQRRQLPYKVFENYQPCDVLFLYGWGGAQQQRAIRAHRGPYVAFDLGYWQREGYYERKWRVSINGFHCPDLIFKGPRPHPSRWEKHRFKVKPQGGNPDGPILLVGNSPKAVKVGAGGWSIRMAQRLRDRFPEREIWYKPKPMRPPERRVPYDRMVTDDIEKILPRCSLVVCRHSNVAVDACRMGVPVACEDGAASSIYPMLDDYENQPSMELRLEFLERLAWWQWSINEVRNGDFWPWIERQLHSLP